MANAQKKEFCPQCEIRALQAAITKESIEASAAKMAYMEGVTAPDHIYRKRLTVCSTCPSLQAGILCAECGSYIAYRAKMLSSACPYPGSNKWKNIQRSK